MITTLALLALAAQDAAWEETRFHRIHLRNGNFIDGRLLRQDPQEVLLELNGSHEITVRRTSIRRVEFVTMRSFREISGVVVPVVERPAPAVEAPAPSANDDLRRSVHILRAIYARPNADILPPLAGRIADMGPEAVAYAASLCVAGDAKLVEAVAEIQDPAVRPAMIATADKGADEQARAAALKFLVREGSAASTAAVLRALDDPSAVVWSTAEAGAVKLATAGAVEVRTLVALMNKRTDKAILARVLERIGDEDGLEAVRELLSGSTADRVAALDALAERPSSKEYAIARELLDDDDENVRKSACLYLGRAMSRASAEALIERLDDESDGVKSHALWALRVISGRPYGVDANVWRAWNRGAP